jgi:hypothetical protein
MERIASLSTGTKLMLASATLLFFDLFLTWQKLPQRFGGKFNFTQNLDAWDGWGLLLGLSTLAFLTLVILRESEIDLSPDVPWNRITFGLAVAMLVIAVVKNLLDAYSAWASYLGIVLAGIAVVGAYLERERPAPEPKPIETGNWKPSVRASTVGGPTAEDANGRARHNVEPRAADSSRRW